MSAVFEFKNENPALSKTCNAPFGSAILILAIGAIVLTSVYGFSTCSPSVFFNGIDSWGNICGGGNYLKNEIKGLKWSGDVKSDSPSVWYSSIYLQSRNCRPPVEGNELKLCVRYCEENVEINIENECRSLLNRNRYDKNTIADKYCRSLNETFHSVHCETNYTVTDYYKIINRCMWPNVANHSSLSEMTRLSPHIVDDVMEHFVVIIVTICFVIMGNICGSLLMVNHPMVVGFGAGSILLVVSMIYAGVQLYFVSDWGEFYEGNVLKSRTAALFVVTCWYFLYVVRFFVCNIMVIKKTSVRASWLIVSHSVRGIPKVLCQPVWTLLYSGFISLYIGITCIYVTNCWQLAANDTGDGVTHIENYAHWLVILCLFVYFYLLNLGFYFQETILAGAVRRWYFKEGLHPITASLLHVCTKNIGSLSLLARVPLPGLWYRIVKRVASDKYTNRLISPTRQSMYMGFFGKGEDLGNFQDKTSDEIVKNIRRAKKVNQAVVSLWTTSFNWFAISMFDLILKERRSYFASVLILATAIILSWTTSLFSQMFYMLSRSSYHCLLADLYYNNGVNHLYFSKRDVLFHMTGIRHISTATVRGRRRYRKLQNIISGIVLQKSQTRIGKLKNRRSFGIPRNTRSSFLIAKYTNVKVAPTDFQTNANAKNVKAQNGVFSNISKTASAPAASHNVASVASVLPSRSKLKSIHSVASSSKQLDVNVKAQPSVLSHISKTTPAAASHNVASVASVLPSRSKLKSLHFVASSSKRSRLASFHSERGVKEAVKFIARRVSQQEESVKIIKVIKQKQVEDEIFDWYL